jgi:hypothetical protein
MKNNIYENMFSVEDTLPKENVYVLAHLIIDNWHARDMHGVHFKVVQLIKGLSETERALLPNENIRKYSYCFGDEGFNNIKSFAWKEFGSDSFNGQDVDYWMPLPKKIIKNKRRKIK